MVAGAITDGDREREREERTGAGKKVRWRKR
jgi:hypothetical protein